MISYSRVTNKDIEDIIECYEKYLNNGEPIRQSIRAAFARNGYLGYKAMDGDESVGYFTFQDGFSLTCPNALYETEMLQAIGEMRYVTVDALMVNDEYRRMGIANQLAVRNLAMLREHGIDCFVVEIWVYPDGSAPAQNVYEKMGNVIYRKHAYGFYQDSERYGIGCPICGKKCKCSALLEVIRLAEKV